MMSPDPPREDSNREEEGNRDLSFNQIGFEDDEDGIIFVHDGPYELDISSQEGSDFGSDNDENGPPRTVEDDDDAPLPHRTRAYYQLLIPFPPAEPDTENISDSLNTQEEILPAAASSNPVSTEVTQSEEKFESLANITIHEDTPKEIPVQKREIQLTQDKVDTIKDVMKGFALPAACIPPWAKEIDEDTWKKRLFDTMDDKTKDQNQCTPIKEASKMS